LKGKGNQYDDDDDDDDEDETPKKPAVKLSTPGKQVSLNKILTQTNRSNV
jgi:hypothetical protein